MPRSASASVVGGMRRPPRPETAPLPSHLHHGVLHLKRHAPEGQRRVRRRSRPGRAGSAAELPRRVPPAGAAAGALEGPGLAACHGQGRCKPAPAPWTHAACVGPLVQAWQGLQMPGAVLAGRRRSAAAAAARQPPTPVQPPPLTSPPCFTFHSFSDDQLWRARHALRGPGGRLAGQVSGRWGRLEGRTTLHTPAF